MFINKKINEGVFVLITLLLVISCIAFTLAVRIDKGKVKEIVIDKYSSEKIQYHIDEKIKVGKYIVIEDCWAFKENENINTFDTTIILRNNDTDEAYEIPTSYEKRDDIKEDYAGEYDYSKCGFYSKVKADKLDIQNNNYEIVIKYNNNDANMFIATGIIIGRKGIVKDNG